MPVATLLENALKYKIFVINLDRSPKRLALMNGQFEKLGLDFERIPAVDGKSLSDETIGKYYSKTLNRKNYFVPLNRNEIGCYISHLNACEKIVAEGLDYAILLEDDVILQPGFEFVPMLVESMERPWDMLKLSVRGREKRVVSNEPLSIRRNGAAGVLPLNAGLVRWNKPPIGAEAYALSGAGAQKILQKRRPFYRPVDVDFQYEWETSVEVMGLSPFFVKLNNLPSDIQHAEGGYHHPFARLLYKLKYAAAKTGLCREK